MLYSFVAAVYYNAAMDIVYFAKVGFVKLLLRGVVRVCVSDVARADLIRIYSHVEYTHVRARFVILF